MLMGRRVSCAVIADELTIDDLVSLDRFGVKGGIDLDGAAPAGSALGRT
jgi:hypothetical protein